ncbi:hypothetical protein Tco_1460937, partial [Tanacetum coccineum]
YDDAQMFDTYVFNGEEVFVAEQSEKVVEEVVSTTEVSAAATITTEEITLAQALAELRSAKPKVVVQEPVQSTTTTTPSTIPKAKSITFRDLGESTTRTTLTPIPSNIKDKGKAKMIEPKKPLKIRRITSKTCKREALRAQEKRNKPPTKAHKKSTMLTYLKHMFGYKQSQLKNKSFEKIQKLFDKAMTKVNMFVDMDTELVKESSKKAEAEMAQESSSKRAGEELEQEIVQDDEVAINAIPLATKLAPIVNFKIHRKGKNGYYEIIRADGSAKTYLLFSQMLKEFDREDLENLWKLVKAKHGNTRPEEGYERVLWDDLKTMFEHHVEDLTWRNL